MTNQSILLKLEELEIKLQKLSKEYNALKMELNGVRQENKELKQLRDKQNEDLKNFQNQDKISKIVSSIAEDTQKSSELKLKINEYIKEIDKCIAHLSE
jgi:uncharacterized coiled-coil DUF342 family protein